MCDFDMLDPPSEERMRLNGNIHQDVVSVNSQLPRGMNIIFLDIQLIKTVLHAVIKTNSSSAELSHNLL